MKLTIFERLNKCGVNKAYIVTGRGALFLTDGLAKTKNIEAVCCHHEQSAGYAAVAESQVTENIALCVVSTGCASTNCVTPVLSAFQDGNPVIFISGQHVLNETTNHTGLDIRTYGQQEADIIKIVESITNYASMVKCAQDVPKVLDDAINAATTGRKGPVWLDIPLDIQSARIEAELVNKYLELPIQMYSEPKKNENIVSQIKHLEKMLQQSERPAILIGSGVRSSGTIDSLKEFVETNQIPVSYGASAPDVFPLGMDYSVGSVGSMGCSREGSLVVQNCDLLLVLGNRLPSILTGPDSCQFARNAKIVVVDIDENEHKKHNVLIESFINCNLISFFKHISKNKLTGDIHPWLESITNIKQTLKDEQPFVKSEKIDLYNFAESLSDVAAKDSVLVTDSGFIEVILPTNMDFYPERRSIHPVSQGAMGFAIPAIVGAYTEGRELICVVGDGTIMMNLQELQTIRHHNIPVKIFVINNNVYSIIRRRQKELFRRRTIGTGLEDGVTVPDFSEVANTFGFSYQRIENSDSLKNGLALALETKGPVLCEVIGRDDQQYIEISHARNKQGKFVRKPLEDQWPFLDREVFESCMVTDIIED